jgi:hypothetical protein
VLDLDPAVDDPLRRQPVGQAGYRALLQRLVDGEAVKAAGDARRAQQRHQQGRLGVALADAVGQHTRRGQLVTLVVSEGDLVAHEVASRADAVMGGQRSSAAPRHERLYRPVRQIQQGRGGQMRMHGVRHHGSPGGDADIENPVAAPWSRSRDR